LAGDGAVLKEFSAAVILRPSVIFGAEDNFFNQFASLARMTGMLPLIGGGHTKFAPVFVGDVADAVLRALDDESCRGKIYELAGPNIYSFKQLLQLMISITGQNPCFISIPSPLAKIQATFLQLLPKPLLTVDQVRLLAYDNVAVPGRLGFSDLGIVPIAAESILPSYLDQYKTGGRLADTDRAA
jgi:NADH dehydrogenase